VIAFIAIFNVASIVWVLQYQCPMTTKKQD